MEQKKSFKITVSTFLLFLAILVILFMAYYIYIEKTNHNKQIADLEENTTNMQNIIDNLQEKINNIINNTDSINGNFSTSNSSVDTDKSLSLSRTYINNNTKLTFDNKKFNINLNENFLLNGSYEIVDSKMVVCNISEYTFNEPEGIIKHNIAQNEKWDISFNINNEKSLEVTEINLPNREVEIIICLFNSFEIGNIFSLQY